MSDHLFFTSAQVGAQVVQDNPGLGCYGGGGMAGQEPSGRPGRVPKALELSGQAPAARELARLLWGLVRDSGLTLRKLEQAPDMPYSRDTISRRLEGRRCPEDAFIEALLMQCAGGDRRRLAALVARVRPLVERARREEQAALSTQGRDVVRGGQESSAALHRRAEQARQLTAELRDRAVGYQRMCWWLLVWNRGLEQALHQAQLEREELQRATALGQESLLRLADVRAQILRQDADRIQAAALLTEAEALRDDALGLAEAAAAGYRLLLDTLGKARLDEDALASGPPQAMPPVPEATTAMLAELRASLAAHRTVLRELGHAVHVLIAAPAPVGPADPGPTQPVPIPAVPIVPLPAAPVAASADRVVRRSAQLPTAADVPGGRRPWGQMVLVPAAVVALVLVVGVLVKSSGSDSASATGAFTAPSSPSSSPLAVATAGSGEAALAGADQFGITFSEPPPNPPDDVRMIAGPGCRTAMQAGDTGGTATLTAADAAGWRTGAFGCGSGYLVSRATRQSDTGNLFTWSLAAHQARPQLCQISVAVPAESADLDLGAAGGHWAPKAVYDLTTPGGGSREPVVIDQHEYQGEQVVLAKDVSLGAGQDLAVRLSGEADPTDTYVWPEYLVASDLTLTCRAS